MTQEEFHHPVTKMVPALSVRFIIRSQRTEFHIRSANMPFSARTGTGVQRQTDIACHDLYTVPASSLRGMKGVCCFSVRSLNATQQPTFAARLQRTTHNRNVPVKSCMLQFQIMSFRVKQCWASLSKVEKWRSIKLTEMVGHQLSILKC
jgi:hypothetical protein